MGQGDEGWELEQEVGLKSVTGGKGLQVQRIAKWVKQTLYMKTRGWAYPGKIGSICFGSRENAGTLGRGCGPDHFLWEELQWKELRIGQTWVCVHLSCIIMGGLL